LEDTQIAPQEFERAFERVYDEIDALEDRMNQRFDRLDGEVREMRAEMRELNNKFDIVMLHITGQN
jgi:Skp family chaperone for outer membrane proteins